VRLRSAGATGRTPYGAVASGSGGVVGAGRPAVVLVAASAFAGLAAPPSSAARTCTRKGRPHTGAARAAWAVERRRFSSERWLGSGLHCVSPRRRTLRCGCSRLRPAADCRGSDSGARCAGARALREPASLHRGSVIGAGGAALAAAARCIARLPRSRRCAALPTPPCAAASAAQLRAVLSAPDFDATRPAALPVTWSAPARTITTQRLLRRLGAVAALPGARCWRARIRRCKRWGGADAHGCRTVWRAHSRTAGRCSPRRCSAATRAAARARLLQLTLLARCCAEARRTSERATDCISETVRQRDTRALQRRAACHRCGACVAGALPSRSGLRKRAVDH
jgi:hypothetical protein